MALTAAEKQKRYRERKKVTRVTVTNKPSVTEQLKSDKPIGPLDVYSSQRWSFLQSRGHVWNQDRQRSFRPAEHGSRGLGVTVPGDPAYRGVYS